LENNSIITVYDIFSHKVRKLTILVTHQKFGNKKRKTPKIFCLAGDENEFYWAGWFQKENQFPPDGLVKYQKEKERWVLFHYLLLNSFSLWNHNSATVSNLYKKLTSSDSILVVGIISTTHYRINIKLMLAFYSISWTQMLNLIGLLVKAWLGFLFYYFLYVY
jgi:hypothetical protein